MSLTLILTRLSSVNLDVGKLGPTCELEQHQHITRCYTYMAVSV